MSPILFVLPVIAAGLVDDRLEIEEKLKINHDDSPERGIIIMCVVYDIIMMIILCACTIYYTGTK